MGRALQHARTNGVVSLAEDGYVVHPSVEHLLLALLDEWETTPSQILASLGTDLEQVRSAIEAALPEGNFDDILAQYLRAHPGIHQAAIYSDPAPDLGIARREAESEVANSGDTHLRPEHLLLGVLAARDSFAARTIAAQGVSASQLRTRLKDDSDD